jgi:uncharacterized protein (TIGR02246 family)
MVSDVRVENAVAGVYRKLIEGWNRRDAEGMSSAVADDGIVIGFDGSQMMGRAQVARDIGRIFADHETATYVTKIREVRALSENVGLLHAVVGMIPPGGSSIMDDRNSVQTVVAVLDGDTWVAALFQTTPAQFHGRPDLAQALTTELEQVRPAASRHR